MDGANATPTDANGSPNASDWAGPWGSPGLRWAVMAISPLGFVENGVLLWFLCFRVRRNPFTAYITHLALADLSSLLCLFLLAADGTFRPELAPGSYHAAATLSATVLFGYNAGLYLLTAISVERCLSVLYPIWYRCHRPRHQSACVCALLWALSCLVTATEHVQCFGPTAPSPTRAGCRAVAVSVGVLSFLVFTPLMLASSAVLVVRIRRHGWASHASRLYLVIAATVATFLLCATPGRLLHLLRAVCRARQAGLHRGSLLFPALGSSANPLIYFFVGSRPKRRFQESLKVVLTRAFGDETRPRRRVAGGSGPAVETVV